jgi:chromosome segregation ATPase
MTSFIGKMMVVLNLVLSLLFMAFAGGVFAIHNTWKQKYDAAMVQFDSEKKRGDSLGLEKDTAAKAHQEALDAAKTRADAAEATRENNTQQIAVLTQQVNDLQTKVKQATGLVATTTGQADARTAESDLRRIENTKLRQQLDAQTTDNRKMQDTLFAKDIELKELKDRFSSVLNEYGDMRTFLATKGLTFDREAIRKAQEPPPKVTGLITDVKNDKTNRPEFVEISLGSDEGLAVGHKMDVIGSGIGARKPDWLGQIRIVEIGPDWAVGRVEQKAANGTIAKGDNATTQL